MPFEKTDEGLIWRDTTKEEALEFRKDIQKGIIKSRGAEAPSVVKLKEPDIRLNFARANSSVLSCISSLLEKGAKPVDIILPVHGSLHIVRKCIKSVLERTYWPYKLIIVDDASDNFTKSWLEDQKFPPNVELIFNSKNRGFSATINRGIKKGNNPYVCLLNSDVLVTDKWLMKMVMAIEADERHAIVNPVTNNTALINVNMQQGADYISMNKAFEMTSQHKYPEAMPTGFCYMFRRELINKIGYFDEGYKNYSEESDWWMRAITHLDNGYYRNYKAILADSVYVFHERGSSFAALGEEKQMDYRKTTNARFHSLWPQYKTWINSHDPKAIMAPFRKEFPQKALKKTTAKYKICWVVRSTSMCGGMKYITDIVNEINERGGDAKVALVLRDARAKSTVLPELRSAPVVFKSDEEFLENFEEKVFKKGIIVSAISELAHLVDKLCKENPELVGINHVQSYDPDIAGDEAMKAMAYSSYGLLPHTFSNSEQITKKLEKVHKIKVTSTIPPGIDRFLFYPRGRASGDDRPTILLSLNRNYPFKGYRRGVLLARYLEALASKNNLELRIMAYGVDSVPESPSVIGLGNLSQVRLARLLGTEVDIFVDPSHYHSYGLPNLEAMASGVPVFSWDNTGINEYGENDKNCVILPEDAPADRAALEIYKLLGDVNKRREISTNALQTVLEHDRENSVNTFITELERKLELCFPPRRIVFVTPHLRKHGGPTTIIQAANALHRRGHDVSLSCIYTDINPEVTVMSKVPINLEIDKIPACDVLVVNSDNPDSKMFSSLPQAKHKLLYKMSHNARFKELEEASLNEKWDKIVTSSDWLKDACVNPLQDWNHPPVTNVERAGWFHYGHDKFRCPPSERKYRAEGTTIIISTLIHHHPLKGTKEVLEVLDRLRRKYPIEVVGIGEVPPQNLQEPEWVSYQYSPSRDRMASILRQTDIWVGGSYTEGLGRMALESMSAGAACVLSNTGPEFAKHGENCLLYPIGDKEGMEKAIEALVDNKELFEKIAENGFLTAEKYSNPSEFVMNLERIIFEVCEK
jgi:glycosyltransferase involved in cell wall biosynthesis/GT2 family glycosyltransferase